MTHASEQQGAMKVRKYFAADMRSALEMVRAQQGPDVLILSNRQLDDGIELITADDSVNEQVLRSLKARTKKSNDIVSDRNTRGPSVKQIKKRRTEATRALYKVYYDLNSCKSRRIELVEMLRVCQPHLPLVPVF